MQFTPQTVPSLTNFYRPLSQFVEVCTSKLNGVCAGYESLIPATSICKNYKGVIPYLNLSWAPQFIQDYAANVDFGYCRVYDKDFIGRERCTIAINAIIERDFPASWATKLKEFTDTYSFGSHYDSNMSYSRNQESALYSCSLTDEDVETRFKNLVMKDGHEFWKEGLGNLLLVSSVALCVFAIYKCYKKKSTSVLKIVPTAAKESLADTPTIQSIQNPVLIDGAPRMSTTAEKVKNVLNLSPEKTLTTQPLWVDPKLINISSRQKKHPQENSESPILVENVPKSPSIIDRPMFIVPTAIVLSSSRSSLVLGDSPATEPVSDEIKPIAVPTTEDLTLLDSPEKLFKQDEVSVTSNLEQIKEPTKTALEKIEEIPIRTKNEGDVIKPNSFRKFIFFLQKALHFCRDRINIFFNKLFQFFAKS